MTWAKIPLPRNIYRSTDEAALPDTLGQRLIDGYIDELGNIRKREGLIDPDFVDISVAKGIDGLYWWDDVGKVIFVCDGSIYAITASDGTYEDITGDSLASGVPVYFATDGTNLIMANGGKMVTYNNTGTTAFMADPDAPVTVSHVAFLDSYILATDTSNRGRFYWSDVGNSLSWNALSFATAEAKPDDLEALHVGYREIMLFGGESAEIWWNDGSTPFRRRERVLERGCIAPHSVQNCGGSWVWLDHERRVVRLDGNTSTPRLVSIPFDNIIRDIDSVDDARSMFIPIGVRAYYVLTFPTANQTFVYDLTTDQWAEWGNYQSGSGTYDRYVGQAFAYAKDWEFNLIGDKDEGKIYKLDDSAPQDVDEDIRFIVQTGHISHGTYAKKKSRRLVIRLKRAAGSATTLADEPKVMLRWRDDNADWQMETGVEVSVGQTGEYDFFVKLDRMGTYRTRQYEFSYTNDSDFILVGMEEDVEVLNA